MANNSIHFNNGKTQTKLLDGGGRAVVTFPDNVHQSYHIFFHPSAPYPVIMREREAGDTSEAESSDGHIPQGSGVTWGRRREVEALAFYNPGAVDLVVYVQPITTFL